MDDIRNAVNSIKKIVDTMGVNAACMPDMRDGGIFCVNKEVGKIYQVTDDGTSVAKTNVQAPESYDYESNGLQTKQINENCRITTSRVDDNGEPKDITMLMCYKDNDDPKLLDIGSNMVDMDNKLDEALKGI